MMFVTIAAEATLMISAYARDAQFEAREAWELS
jgi:hypothetical protein